MQEHKGTSNHKEQCPDGHRDDEDRQDDPVSNNNSYLGKENQKRDSLLVSRAVDENGQDLSRCHKCNIIIFIVYSEF